MPLRRATSSCLQAAIPACALLALIACGGGGGGGGGTTPPPSGNQPPPVPPAPPAVDRSPEVVLPNQPQHVAQMHALDYDASQGGKTFSDPDGDKLTYQLFLGGSYLPLSMNPPPGVTATGTRVTGVAQTSSTIYGTIMATDPTGGSTYDTFTLFVDPNQAPRVVVDRKPVLVRVGESLSVDATLGGTRFADPEGDALTYKVSTRGIPGITINGTQVAGSLTSIGAVEVTVTAQDPYGASTDEVFLIAAPGPLPGSPTLPATRYSYEYPQPDMPFVHREIPNALFDTQRDDNPLTNAGATLGRVLFHDKRLSVTNTVACASCHQQAHGFAGSEKFNTGVLGIALTRQAMPLANTRYNINDAWFSDMRARSLQTVAKTAMQSTAEMGMTTALLEEKLGATAFYAPLFEAAFGTPAITEQRVLQAIEQYLRSLVSYRSKFDRAYNSMDNSPVDPAQVLTAQEMRGYDIFRGKVGGLPCVMCHQFASGTNVWQANNGIDVDPPDPGTTDPALQRDGSIGVFRAASLRNIAHTAPYMHDGRFATLRDVINHYDHGINQSRNLDALLRDTSRNPIRMNLSEEDKDALEAFLNTYSDDAMLADPKFADPFQ